MLKVITFLGLGPKDGYHPTTYVKHDKSESHRTHLFPEAVAELYEPDLNIILVTEKVLKDPKGYLAYLKGQLTPKLREVQIPDGKSENELWDIFDICAKQIEPNDKIILDITHGFRSSPLLIFIVAAYLRQVKNVDIQHILYGAFEARDPVTGETPIFDLTPFLELLNWMNAVSVFQNYGDARPIAGIAKSMPTSITDVLSNLSDALLTNRTLEAQEAAKEFNTEFSTEFGTTPATKQTPFIMLVDELRKSYQQMAVNNPTRNPKESLKKQYQQIKWYMENQHYIQAITLMREWLISYECHNYPGNWLDRKIREEAEDNIRHRVLFEEPPVPIGLWEDCKIRHDLAHCGMRLRPRKAAAAITKIKKLFQDFKNFAKSTGLV